MYYFFHIPIVIISMSFSSKVCNSFVWMSQQFPYTFLLQNLGSGCEVCICHYFAPPIIKIPYDFKVIDLFMPLVAVVIDLLMGSTCMQDLWGEPCLEIWLIPAALSFVWWINSSLFLSEDRFHESMTLIISACESECIRLCMKKCNLASLFFTASPADWYICVFVIFMCIF